MHPQTSVIMPVRNGIRFIEAGIESALVQLASHDEIVVIDDASTDDTRAVLGRMQDARIRVLSGTGRGVSSARNIGLAAAAGEFIAFLDHDDLWPPLRHAVLLQALLADETVDCALGRLLLRMEPDAIMLPQLADMEGSQAPTLSLCTGLFRRRIIDSVGYFNENMRFAEDTDYYLRLKEQGYRNLICDVDALFYRRHSSNSTCDVAGAADGMMQLIRARRKRISSVRRPRD